VGTRVLLVCDQRITRERLSCLLKDWSPDELFLAIEAATRNQSYLSPPIAHLVVDTCVLHPSKDLPRSCVSLTKREEGILRLITEGKTTRDIASCLALSPRTVSAHRQRLMNKLKIHKSIDLFRYAIRQGLTSIAH
jgi:DNA-binding NarL/FixJ family response regulator